MQSPREGLPTAAPVGARLSAVDVARRVLLRVEAGSYASLTLSGELDRAQLADSARGLCTELVYGSLRKRAQLDAALSRLTPRGLDSLDVQVRVLLRLGAYQVLFTRVPPARAVNEVVTALRGLRGPGLAGFANALLRRLVREGLPPAAPLASDASPKEVCKALATRHGLPTFLVRDVLDLLGRSGAESFCQALETPAPTWLRLNSLRGSWADARAALVREGADLHSAMTMSSPDLQPSATENADRDAASQSTDDASAHELATLLPEAVRLQAGHPFSGAAYEQGWFTAQDLGAQLVARLLLADTDDGPLDLPAGPVLDACCGTGGKATHLAALLSSDSAAGQAGRSIDAADRSLRKLDLCQQHSKRLRCRDLRPLPTDLLSADALAATLRPRYAAILLDAPCGGSGVLRRHPEARSRLTWDDVQALAGTQRRLLELLLPYLAEGGVLVYAVCSVLRCEGPDLIAQLLRDHPDLSLLPPASSQAGWSQVYRNDPAGLFTWPHVHNADGFYAVRLRRVPPAKQARHGT